MHRKHRVRSWLTGGLLALGLAAPGAAPAQPAPPAQPPAAPPAATTQNVLVVSNNWGGTADFSGFMKRFGDMLRYVLDVKRSAREDVTLADELQFVRDYLSLEKLRLGDRLRVVPQHQEAVDVHRVDGGQRLLQRGDAEAAPPTDIGRRRRAERPQPPTHQLDAGLIGRHR